MDAHCSYQIEGVDKMAEFRSVVKGKNLDVTPALRAYAEKKVAKFDKYLGTDQQAAAEVMLRTEKDQHIAEVTLSLTGLILRGEGKTADMYSSLDSAVERIERQFSKFKSKIQRKIQGPKISELNAGAEGRVVEEEKEAQVVRTKRFAFKPMDIQEAIMQMELLGHDFFVFSNANSDEVNVVYKRRDGNYGLIEPEF